MRNAIVLALAPLVGCTTAEVATDETSSEITSYEVARTVAANLGSRDGGGASGAFYDGAMLAFGVIPSGFFKLPDGTIRRQHDGTDYLYRLYCRDANGSAMATCNSHTKSATVSATWEERRGGSSFESMTRHDLMWTIDNLDTKTATVRGVGLVDGSVAFTRNASATRYSVNLIDTYTLAMDMPSYRDIPSVGFDVGPHCRFEPACRDTAMTAVYPVSARRTQPSGQVTGADRMVGGTFDTDLTAKSADNVINDVHGLVVFERSAAPTLLVNGEQFPLDLATGDVQVILQ